MDLKEGKNKKKKREKMEKKWMGASRVMWLLWKSEQGGAKPCGAALMGCLVSPPPSLSLLLFFYGFHMPSDVRNLSLPHLLCVYNPHLLFWLVYRLPPCLFPGKVSQGKKKQKTMTKWSVVWPSQRYYVDLLTGHMFSDHKRFKKKKSIHDMSHSDIKK